MKHSQCNLQPVPLCGILHLFYYSNHFIAIIGEVKVKTKGTAWIIGASSGLGLATAQAFAKDGWLVVAGARSFTMPEDRQVGEAYYHLPLDVTDEGSCNAFVREALTLSNRVDVLCYSAGLLSLGSCEETGTDLYERVMSTNFLGMTRMITKVLPVMREQGSGKLFLFSSLNGILGIPFQSAYTASKHAIEGYAQCLAMEVRPFGISVCVVEPGDHQKGSQAYRLKLGNLLQTYAKEYASTCMTIQRDEMGGLHPETLGLKVLRQANRRKPRYRLRIARLDQRTACWLHGLLPPGLFFAGIRAYYVKKG